MRKIFYSMALTAFLTTSLLAEEIEYAWLDDLHLGVTDSLYDSAIWFDDFFATANNQDQDTKASAKIRLGWEPEEQNLEKLKSRIRLRVRLPNLRKKTDLIFSDYNESTEEGITDEIIDDRSNRQEDDFNVALRWVHKSDKRHYFSTRIGLDSEPDIYTKALYRQVWETTSNTNIMLQPSVYYYLDQGFAARFSGNFEYNLNDKNLFQLTNSWGYIEDEDDTKWRHSILFFHQVDEKQAFISGVYANGITEHNYHLEDKGVFVRYRWQALRQWLYFEVEPFVHWPEKNEFDQTFGMTFRIEAKFKRF